MRQGERLTQQDLADSLDVSLRTVQNWEAGSRSPDYASLSALARALRTSQAYLLGETDDPRPPEPTGPPPEPTLADAARLARDLADVLERLARGAGGG